MMLSRSPRTADAVMGLVRLLEGGLVWAIRCRRLDSDLLEARQIYNVVLLRRSVNLISGAELPNDRGSFSLIHGGRASKTQGTLTQAGQMQGASSSRKSQT